MNSPPDLPPVKRNESRFERCHDRERPELLEAYRPHPGMGRFMRRHPVLMVTWAVLGAGIFYGHLATLMVLLIP